MTASRERPLVLVTGAAGRVGTALRPYLRHRFDLRLHDRVPAPDPREGESVVVGDLADFASVDAATAGVDAVLHLACVHGLDLRFADSLDANFLGTMNVLDAIRRHGVPRLVYASSHHVLGLHPADAFPGDDAELAPDGVYALGKAFGEVACCAYARRYGTRTLIVRIGNADKGVGDGRVLRLWTSARDLAQLVTIGVEHPEVTCDVVYGVSECPEAFFANERARQLGYRPRDRAEENLAPGRSSPDALPPGVGGAFLGGAYAASDLAAPWEDA